MKTRQLFLLLLTLLLVQSCSPPRQISWVDSVHNLFRADQKSIECKLYGSYQAELPMTNGELMFVALSEDNSYVEKNAFGTFYGTWSVAREGFRYYKTRYEIIIRIDSIDSPFSLHYDGELAWQSMRTSMYYYYPNSEMDSAIIIMKDRTGSPINLFHVCARNDANKTIDVLNAEWDSDCSVERYNIPPETARIGVMSMEGDIDCECRYNPDSGNIAIVVTPHFQDTRMRVKGRDLYFFQYDKYGMKHRKTRIRLLRQDAMELELLKTVIGNDAH